MVMKIKLSSLSQGNEITVQQALRFQKKNKSMNFIPSMAYLTTFSNIK